jgi:hypothetical protein
MVRLDEEGEYDEEVVLVVRVDYYLNVKGDSSTWASDMDFYGYEEMDYTIIDVFVDDGKFGTSVPFTDDMFQDDANVERIEEAIREANDDGDY